MPAAEVSTALISSVTANVDAMERASLRAVVLATVAAWRAGQVGERLAKEIPHDDAGLADAAAVVARRSLGVLALTGAGLAATLALSAWWVRSG